MKKEDINVTSTHISLNYGDYIIDSSGTTEQVAYVDYVAKMVIAIPIDCEPVVGDLSSCSRTNIITFDDIVSDYQKVLEDANTIKTTNGDISIEAGDAIINNGRLLQVIDVAYDSGLVDISEYGNEYTISLTDIESVERIDSVTQIVTTNPRKNRLIIIANGIKPHSCDKEDKDDYVAVANNSPRVGDFIVDSDGNKYKVGMVDYGNLFIVAVSKDGEQRTIHFDKFSEGQYSKVLNKVGISAKIGDEITGAEGNKYKVVDIDYNDYEVIVRSADGEEFSFNLDGFDSSVYKKVLK